MKVKLLVGRCGPDINQVAGDIVEVDDETGKRMVLKGQCEPVKRGRQKATAKPEETSVE